MWLGMPKVPKIKSLQHLLQYFKKEGRDKYDSLHEDKYQSFLQAGMSFLLVIARYAQRTQNSKFVMSLIFFEVKIW